MSYGGGAEGAGKNPRGKSSVSKANGWARHVNTKIRRLRERRDPENAPTKNRYHGWAD